MESVKASGVVEGGGWSESGSVSLLSENRPETLLLERTLLSGTVCAVASALPAVAYCLRFASSLSG